MEWSISFNYQMQKLNHNDIFYKRNIIPIMFMTDFSISLNLSIQDYSVSSLTGHCYFKIGNTEKAIECYEFARMLFDRPDDLHLVEVR